MSLRGYSQKVILNEKKDTMICFTVNQSKFLLKKVYQAEECDTLRKICETQSLLKDTILSNKEKEITALKMIYDNTNTMLKLKEYEIDKLKQSLQLANDEARKQKRHKWFFIGTTAVVSLFTGYYVLTH
jgi:hypothetical protein